MTKTEMEGQALLYPKVTPLGPLDFQVLYPAEGNSSILEVSENSLGAFLYVHLGKEGALTYDFFVEGPFNITERDFVEINAVARKSLSWVDLSTVGHERFDEN